MRCGIGLLEPVSEYGRLCHGAGATSWGDRRRRERMLPTLRGRPGARPKRRQVGLRTRSVRLAMTVEGQGLSILPLNLRISNVHWGNVP